MQPIGEIIQNAIETGCVDRCILCGGAPYVVGVFAPDNPEEWGAPAGKARFLLYGVCRKCFADHPDPAVMSEKVEKVIQHELAGAIQHNLMAIQ